MYWCLSLVSDRGHWSIWVRVLATVAWQSCAEYPRLMIRDATAHHVIVSSAAESCLVACSPTIDAQIIRHGRIKTTLVRARAVRKFVDHMVQLGKRGNLHARRQALGYIYDKSLVHALFEQAPTRYGALFITVHPYS